MLALLNYFTHAHRKHILILKCNYVFLLQIKNYHHDDTRKKVKHKIPHSLFQAVKTNKYVTVCARFGLVCLSLCAGPFKSICPALVSVCREMQIVENLITRMSSVVKRRKKLLQLRSMCCEERVWKSHLNHTMAKAYIALLYERLTKLQGEAPQYRCTCSCVFLFHLI